MIDNYTQHLYFYNLCIKNLNIRNFSTLTFLKFNNTIVVCTGPFRIWIVGLDRALEQCSSTLNSPKINPRAKCVYMFEVYFCLFDNNKYFIRTFDII